MCGAPLTASQPQQPYQQQPYQQQPYQQPYQQQAYQQPYQAQPYQQQPMYVDNGASGKATASLVLGILSLIICGLGLPLGIIGLVLGVQARNAMPEGTPGRGKATAGMVMSIIACVWGAIAIVCTICSAVTGETSYYTILSGLL